MEKIPAPQARVPGTAEGQECLAFILDVKVFFEKYRRKNLNLTCRVTEEAVTIGHLKIVLSIQTEARPHGGFAP
jgi:hypothetical protein